MRVFRDNFDYMIHLVRCAIHDDAPSELPDGATFDLVYKWGTRHDIANIAYYSVKKLRVKPEEDLLKKWESRQNSAVVREINQTYAREELLGAFETAGIPAVEVQGTKIKHLYPRPEYRTMSDMDFIVKPEDLCKAKGILEELGYKCQSFRDFDVSAARDPNITIEIHTSFFSADTPYAGMLGDPFEGAPAPGGSFPVGRELLYLYTVLHTAKHYFYAGCGVRRVLDLYLISREYPDAASSDAVRELLDKAGLREFVSDMSELAECWFGEDEREPDGRLSRMIGIIKNAGVHGTSSQKISRELERDTAGGGAKTRYVLRRLFPEKWVMLESYPVLRRVPVLMPFCWVHRSFKAITKNRSRLSRELKTLRDTDPE